MLEAIQGIIYVIAAVYVSIHTIRILTEIVGILSGKTRKD